MLWKDDGDWVKKSMSYEVEDVRGRGRPRMTWSQVVERDMRERGLKREDAQEHVGSHGQLLCKQRKRL